MAERRFFKNVFCPGGCIDEKGKPVKLRKEKEGGYIAGYCPECDQTFFKGKNRQGVLVCITNNMKCVRGPG